MFEKMTNVRTLKMISSDRSLAYAAVPVFCFCVSVSCNVDSKERATTILSLLIQLRETI